MATGKLYTLSMFTDAEDRAAVYGENGQKLKSNYGWFRGLSDIDIQGEANTFAILGKTENMGDKAIGTTVNLTKATNTRLGIGTEIASKMSDTPFFLEDVTQKNGLIKGTLIVRDNDLNMLTAIPFEKDFGSVAAFEAAVKKKENMFAGLVIAGHDEKGTGSLVNTSEGLVTWADIKTAIGSKEESPIERTSKAMQDFRALDPSMQNAFTNDGYTNFVGLLRSQIGREAVFGGPATVTEDSPGKEEAPLAGKTKERFDAFKAAFGNDQDKALDALKKAGPGRVANLLADGNLNAADSATLDNLMNDYAKKFPKDAGTLALNGTPTPDTETPVVDTKHVEPHNALVKRLQAGILEKDPKALPKHGADGRRGPETADVLLSWAKENKVDLGDLSNEAIANAFEKSDALKQLAQEGDKYIASHTPKPKQRTQEALSANTQKENPTIAPEVQDKVKSLKLDLNKLLPKEVAVEEKEVLAAAESLKGFEENAKLAVKNIAKDADLTKVNDQTMAFNGASGQQLEAGKSVRR